MGKKNNQDILDVIYQDLHKRLHEAGATFNQLPTKNLVAFLKKYNIADNQVKSAMDYLQYAFQYRLPKKEDLHQGSVKMAQDVVHESHAPEPMKVAQSEHPYAKTKHEPRKNVFGTITKITK